MGHMETERVEKPWGAYERFTRNEASTVKLLTLNPGASISLQRHASRTEFWRVLSGAGTAVVGEAELEAAPGASFTVAVGEAHRLIAGGEGLTVLEISFGDFDENDIVRLEDAYGRA